jgi:predicted permease
MSSTLHDLRVVIRQLSQKPLFVAVAVLTLAIGMGVNTVAFSVVNGVLFKGLVATAPPDVGRIIATPGGDEEGNASLAEYERFREGTRDVLDLAAEGRSTIGWRHDGRTEPAHVLFVSANYFSMVNGEVLAGRQSVDRVAGGNPGAVVGERFWREQLGSPALTGLTLQLNHVAVDVVGIMRESFTGPAGLYSPDVWLSLEDLAMFRTSHDPTRHGARWLFVLGKVREGSTPAAVQGHLDTAAAIMAREWPETHAGRGARFRLLSERNSELQALTVAATIGMAVIGLILLLACFNVANLLLARALDRERDMGIRTALGASPLRLMRLVILEGAILAVLSGVVALGFARWTQTLVASFAIPIDVPQHIDFSPDGRVVVYIGVLVVLAGVLPGLWPALAAARVSVTRVLAARSAQNAGGRPSRLRRTLVAAQVAGSTAFLAVAILFVQSYTRLLSVDVGFARDRIIVVDVDPVNHGHSLDSAASYAERLVERWRGLPGVVTVAMTDRAPFFIGFERDTVVWPVDGSCAGAGCPAYPTYAIGPGYFDALDIRLLAGHELQPSLSPGEVIVNASFARERWPQGGGLGETIRIGRDGRPVTVVGIASRTQMRGIERERPSVFLPLQRDGLAQGLAFIIRTTDAPEALVRAVGDAAHEIDADVPLLSVKTMEQRMAVQLWPFRTLSLIFAICGGLALLLAVVGVAGVVVHAVQRRTREFGIRVSVGASPRDVSRDVLSSGLRLLLPGLVIGTAGAIAVARLAQAMLIGVNIFNPMVYAGVAMVQCAVVMAACLLPARRATRMDPLAALRSD